MKLEVSVADSGPLHYLALIGELPLLPVLFEAILTPSSVQAELSHHNTPEVVRRSLGSPPEWLQVVAPANPSLFDNIHRGESDAIQIAIERGISLILMDDQNARAVAIANRLTPIGTIGLLEVGDARNLIDLATALERLRQTNFFGSEKLFKSALERSRARNRAGRVS